MSVPSSSSPPMIQSNLKSFLHSVTPDVTIKPFSLNEIMSHKLEETVVDESEKYFILEDLWKFYDEWSVYGACTPVVLNTSENVVQYYTPYLSAIQLYTNRDSVDSTIDQDCSLTRSKFDHVSYRYLEYCETISPYLRVPFMDKIDELAKTSPGLNLLKSTELSPASWMSIAWCPIYHIPNKGKIEDLSTHFLTFHTLSSCFLDNQGNNDICINEEEIVQDIYKKRNTDTTSLPPFGLCSLGMQGDVWMNQGTNDYEKLINLHCAADSWLKQVGFHHNDFYYYQRKNQEVGSIFK